MKLKLLVLLIAISLFIGDISENSSTTNSTTYRSLVDGYKGFYRVVIAGAEQPPYENHTLNINVGDKMVWSNEDLSETLTIISEQELWKDKDAVLRHTGSQFSYIFDRTGIFTFYIKQYKGLPKQTIIVSELVSAPTPTPNETTPVPTPTETTPTPTPNETTPTPTPTETEVIPIPTETTPIPTPTETEVIPTPTETDIEPIPTITNVPVSTETEAQNNIVDTTENMTPINPILMPVNILQNLKKTGFISFVVIIVIFLIIK